MRSCHLPLRFISGKGGGTYILFPKIPPPSNSSDHKTPMGRISWFPHRLSSLHLRRDSPLSGERLPVFAMEKAFGANFPVIFFDGDTEIDLGVVAVHPSLEFKSFQATLSKKIGISPHQISVYLDCPKRSRSYPDRGRRIPISSKFNFAAAFHRRNSFFQVVLKRSRRERRRRPPPQKVLDDESNAMMLLRRSDRNSLFYSFDPTADSDLQMATKMNSDLYLRGGMMNDRAVCEYCCKEGGERLPFHWCVYDAVTVGFRSPAGPISRPVKASS